MAIWVLSCGGHPFSWHTDKQVLMDSISSVLSGKRWQQINSLVWETTDKSWSVVSVDEAKK